MANVERVGDVAGERLPLKVELALDRRGVPRVAERVRVRRVDVHADAPGLERRQVERPEVEERDVEDVEGAREGEGRREDLLRARRERRQEERAGEGREPFRT